MQEDIKLPKDLIWSSEDGYFKAKINGYELCVTNNGIRLWWGVQFNEEIIDSTFRKENNLKTIEEAKKQAYLSYLKHYNKDFTFPDDLEK